MVDVSTSTFLSIYLSIYEYIDVMTCELKLLVFISDSELNSLGCDFVDY